MGLGPNQSTRVEKFREFMSKDQHMGSAGTDRVRFYDGVVSQARKVR